MHALLGHLDILNRIRGSKTEFVGLYGGTAHKDSNSTRKGFLRTFIFQYHFAKVST